MKKTASNPIASVVEEKDGKKDQTNTERLALLKSRLSLAKSFSKKPHEAWKKWVDEYNIEDFGDTDEVRDKVRIGYIFRKSESDLPSIFDDQPDIFIKGRRGTVKDIEPLINGIYDFLWDVQDLEEQIEDVGLYFIVLGMGFIKSPYVTKTKPVTEPVLDATGQPVVDEKGNPVTKTYNVPSIDWPMAYGPDPFKLYFSPETKFAPILDYDHCPYYFEELVMTPEKIKADFGKEVTEGETLKIDGVDLDKDIEGNREMTKSDLKRNTVYEYYGCLPENMAKGIKDDNGNETKWSYDQDYHLYFTNNEELKVEVNPYDSKPLFVVGNYGIANKFWKFGDPKHLMPLVQELQMYRSQILQHTRKIANPKPLLPNTANVDESAFEDPRVGKPVKYDGPTAPSYLSPAPLGKEVEIGTEMARTDLEKTAGSFDLAIGAGQSTVRTPAGIKTYSAAADKNVIRKRKKIARLIRHLIIFQLKQIGQNWKPEDNKVINIVNPGSEEAEALEVSREVLKILNGVSIMYNLDIEAESLAINDAQQKEDAIELWSAAEKHPEIFNLVECAKDLLQNGYHKRDAKRYLLSEEDKAKIAQRAVEKPSVSVNVRADAATPIGEQLLANEGLITSDQSSIVGTAQAQDVIDQTGAGEVTTPVVQPNGSDQTQPAQ